MNNGDNCRISSQKSAVISIAADLPTANVLLVVICELPFASLHKTTATVFWIGIALRKFNRQKPSYAELWRFSNNSSDQYSSLWCTHRNLSPCAGCSTPVPNINFSFISLFPT